MFSIFDADDECPLNASELAGSRAGHHDHLHLGAVRVHGGKMLQGKAAVLAVKHSGHDLNGHVTRRALPGIAACKHFADGRCLQLAVNHLVDGEAAEACGGRRRKGMNVDGEAAMSVLHGNLLADAAACDPAACRAASASASRMVRTSGINCLSG